MNPALVNAVSASHSVPRPPSENEDYIDALRGLAILGVIAVHVVLWTPTPSPQLSLLAQRGTTGVQLFFVASALTLFLSHERRNVSDSGVRSFFIRRFFRIAPLYYLAAIYWMLLHSRGAAPEAYFSWANILGTFTFCNGWLPSTIHGLVPGGWSITVEFTFYAILPFLFRRLNDLASALGFFCGSLALALVANRLLAPVLASLDPFAPSATMAREFSGYWFFNQLPVFAAGIILYHCLRLRHGAHRDPRLGRAFLAFFIVLAVSSLTISTFIDLLSGHVCFALAFIFLALGLFHTRSVLAVNPLVTWIGRLSFSLYICHFIVIDCLKSIWPTGLRSSSPLGMPLAFILVTSLSLVLSIFTHRWIERPGVALGKKLAARFKPSLPITAAPANHVS